MFFKDSEAAGVLLVYDVSNPRYGTPPRIFQRRLRAQSSSPALQHAAPATAEPFHSWLPTVPFPTAEPPIQAGLRRVPTCSVSSPFSLFTSSRPTLLRYDNRHHEKRSLRELPGLADELASEGVHILNCSSIGGAGRGSTSAADGVLDGGDTALRRRDRHGGQEGPADLEGGSRGAAAAVRGRVPLLVVGTKEDMGEGFRRAGAELAGTLGAGHITVVSGGSSCRIVCTSIPCFRSTLGYWPRHCKMLGIVRCVSAPT